MKSLLDADDDWIEGLRLWLWPKLHPLLKPFGGYATGDTPGNQYVGTLDIGEEAFEEWLVEAGFERNPVACLKTNDHGEVSEGSWALRSHADPNGVLARERQLHVTLYSEEEGDGLDVYAHEEYDWQDRPIAHLRAKKFKPRYGRDYMARLLRESGLIT